MAVFGVVVEDQEIIKEFFKEVKEKLGTTNLVRNPFTGGVISFRSERRVKGETKVNRGYIIKMSPFYFNFAIVGFMFTLVLFFIWPRSWIGIAAIIFMIMNLFWSGKFYYFIMKKGLKKKGYKGTIRYLKPKEIIEEVYFNGNE